MLRVVASASRKSRLGKQHLDNKWDCESEDASNATPRQMLPPPPRLSGNAEVWQRPQSAPARSQTYVVDVPCALIMIEDEYGRRDGDRRKTCHVCWKALPKRYLRAGHWTLVGDASIRMLGSTRGKLCQKVFRRPVRRRHGRRDVRER